MKWIVPQIGQTKTRKKFAFFPTIIVDFKNKIIYRIWLESYIVNYEYIQKNCYVYWTKVNEEILN